MIILFIYFFNVGYLEMFLLHVQLPFAIAPKLPEHILLGGGELGAEFDVAER